MNLFNQLAEPIILDQSRFEYRVIPDVNRPLATEVYSVERVSSNNSLLAESRQFEPFYAMRHADRSGTGGAAHWLASRRPSLRQGDPGTEVYLSFVDNEFNPARPASETLSVRTLCTNRDLPPRLPFGGDQGDFQLESPGPISRVRCLRKPTPALRPHLARAAHWGLISHLALNHLSLASSTQGLDSLREVLRLHEWAESSANRQQIEGLIGLSSRRVAGRSESTHGRAICHGVEVELEFDESHFAGSGMFLFASVLERFLGMYTTINGFSRLVARSRQREGMVKRWPAPRGLPDLALEQELFEKSYRFEFFQAVHLLEQITPDRKPVGELGPAPMRSFASAYEPAWPSRPSEIERLSPSKAPGQPPRPERRLSRPDWPAGRAALLLLRAGHGPSARWRPHARGLP